MEYEKLLNAAVNDPAFNDVFLQDLRQPQEFPAFIKKLPRANYGNDAGEALRGYVLQSKGHQLVFNENDEPMQFQKHRHAQSFGVVLQGECKLVVNGIETIYRRGDVYHVPGGVEHYAWQSANYKDIVIFDEPFRVETKSTDL